MNDRLQQTAIDRVDDETMLVATPPDATMPPSATAERTGTPAFRFDNTYARELDGFHVPRRPDVVADPRLLFFNDPLARELGLDPDSLDPAGLAAVFGGNVVPDGAEPIAQVYAGHQFGGFSPRLGDGRALLLGEVIDCHGQRRDIAFKGSGATIYARGGDGKAAVGPMLREALVSESMHALGIPTTRSLAVVATGERVYRDTGALPGAVLTRVAASHIRVGTFQYFAARGDIERVRRLADYTIARHDSMLADMAAPERYAALLRNVIARQAALIAQWLNVGFIHGVMNTDNMALSGETIDYGPCAFIEAYDPAAVFSSIDHGGRYAFGNQPGIALWNLTRLAETLLPLLSADEDESIAMAKDALGTFGPQFRAHLLRGQRAKLGLRELPERGTVDDDADAALASDWLAVLHAGHVDYTLAWRRLADAAAGDDGPLRALFADQQPLDAWLVRWRDRISAGSSSSGAPDAKAAERAAAMRRVNPIVIARNHRVEEALAAASDRGDLAPFERLLEALRHPYDERPEFAAYAEPAPAAVTACYRTFCGT